MKFPMSPPLYSLRKLTGWSFFREIFRRHMWVRGMGQLRNMWLDGSQLLRMHDNEIYIDKNDNHDGHHCCKCCLMISWPDFRCRPSLCKASWTLNRDIKSADATWHRMTLAPRYCIWTKFALERNALRIPTLHLTWWAVILPGEGSYWLILIHATFEQQFFSTLPSLEWPDVLSLYLCIANFAWFGASV